MDFNKREKNVFATDKTNTIQPNSNWLQGCILKDKKLAMGLNFFNFSTPYPQEFQIMVFVKIGHYEWDLEWMKLNETYIIR